MRIKLLASVLLALLSGSVLFGQTSGEITGEVRDPSGGVITGAMVSVANRATGALRTVTRKKQWPRRNPVGEVM